MEDEEETYEPDAAVEAYLTALSANEEEENDKAAIAAGDKAATSGESIDTSDEGKDTVTEVEPDDEAGKTEEAKAPVVEDKERESLARISAREEAVRLAESEFEKKVTEAATRKFSELKGKDHKDLLKNAGLDEELTFKLMLLERISDDKPQLKAKLEAELRDYKHDKQIKDLESKLAAKEDAEASAKYIAGYNAQAREYVEKVDEKVTPVVSKLVKAGKVDYVFQKAIAEVAKDAQLAYARGENRDVLTPAQAVALVEKDLAVLAEVFASDASKKPVVEAKKPVGSITNPRVPAPKQPVSRTKTAQEEEDELLERSITVGLSSAAKQRMIERQKR